MTAISGRRVRLAIDFNKDGNYTDVGSGKTLSTSRDNPSVDITSGQDKYTVLLPDGGIKNMNTTISGVLKSSGVHQKIINSINSGQLTRVIMSISGFEKTKFNAQISNYTTDGANTDAVQFNLTLESSGEPEMLPVETFV